MFKSTANTVQTLATNKALQLTVIVPVYNEQETIAKILAKIFAITLSLEVIVVDDGSFDHTYTILKTLQKKYNFILLRHSNNLGKGSAIKTAITHATGAMVIIQDGDLEYEPEEYYKLITPIRNGKSDVVFGSRRMNKRFGWKQLTNPFYHGVTALNVLVYLLYKQKITDEACCYKVFKLQDLQRMNLQCKRFEFCPEVTAKSCRLNLKITEVPVSYTPRSLRDGKKIGYKDAIEAVKTLYKYTHWEE